MAVLAGCGGKPNAANIALRGQVQTLEADKQRLERQHAADRAEIAALRSGGRVATLPSLPDERIGRLFTTTGIEFGRLTRGADLDPTRPGDDGIKVYFWPTDSAGDKLKAAGAVTIELFDLAADAPRLGRWKFDLDQLRACWVSNAILDGYVVPCPWQSVPSNNKLRVRVAFTDELTGRQFTADREITAAVAKPTAQTDADADVR
jgi:hypothetical protein